jgi:hypothetical protein
MGYSRFERNREVPQSSTIFMDPNDPRSHGGESHNGPAAEVEPAHSEQDSSQFQTPGTVHSMSAALKTALALAAFAQGVVAFEPATRLAAPRTVAAANQMGRLSYDCQAYAPGGYNGIMGAAVVDLLSNPTEDGSNLIVSQFSTVSRGRRAPHRGTSLGPFVCGARACSLCSYSSPNCHSKVATLVSIILIDLNLVLSDLRGLEVCKVCIGLIGFPNHPKRALIGPWSFRRSETPFKKKSTRHGSFFASFGL